MRYTQHESMYREDVKLLLHISNTNQNNVIPLKNISIYDKGIRRNIMIPIENKQNILKIPIEGKQKKILRY